MPTPSLDLSPDDLDALLSAAMAHLRPWLASLPSQPADGTSLPHPPLSVEPSPPADASPAEAVLASLFQGLPRSLHTAHPGYFAYIPGGGLPHAAVADLIANLTNRFTGLRFPAPQWVQHEEDTLRWLCALIGWHHPQAGGVYTSGGSLANLYAVVAARRARLPDDFLSGRLYTSSQAHHSVLKAALTAGFPAASVVEIPTDDDLRISLPALTSQLAADRAAGRTPFLIVANAGSTNTGAVDPLDALADLAAAEGLHLHVDGAYGGFFAWTERGRRTLAGLDRADSITLDPHKGLGLPYGTGCLLVRDRALLRRAFAVSAAYLPASSAAEEAEVGWSNFGDLSPELSRDFRGLRVWLPWKLLGTAAFVAHLDEKLDLAAHAASVIAGWPGVVSLPTQLSVVAFRLEDNERGDSSDIAADNARNQRWLAAVNARQRAHLSATTIRGRFTLRLAILSFRSHLPDVMAVLEDLQATLPTDDGAPADAALP